MNTLTKKIDDSIALIKKAENLALHLSPSDGFYVGFSGGKDSQALLELVKIAGVKYIAVYSPTTNEHPDAVRFIRQHYPEVIFDIPTNSYFQLIEKKGLPTKLHRWCCKVFKEVKGTGHVTLTGVRAEESRKRAAYSEVSKFGKNASDKQSVNLDTMKENEFRCVNGKDKYMIYPILRWTEEDIWSFIRQQGLPINPLYSQYNRVGCIFCPFARKGTIEKYCATHPKQKQAFINAIQRYVDRKEELQKYTAQQYYEWWLSNDSLKVYDAKKRQLSLFEDNL